jgi:drug/metabolite transporter (DMT)-like permease
MIGSLSNQGLFFGFLAAFFWGTHSVIVRYLDEDISGMAVACLRLYIAALTLFVILKLRKHPVSIKLSDKTFLITMLAATVNFVFFHIGLQYTSASNAMLLENTAPLFVVIGLFVIGVFFTVRQDFTLAGEEMLGDLLEIAAGLVWAVFIVASSRALSSTASLNERMNYLFGVFLVSAVLMSPFLFFAEYNMTLLDLVLLVLLGIFPTAVAYMLWYEAAARVSTITAALLFSLSIIFTFFFAYVFLGEEIVPDMIIGGALIVIGVALSKFAPARS